jgi:hypothetical protein
MPHIHVRCPVLPNAKCAVPEGDKIDNDAFGDLGCPISATGKINRLKGSPVMAKCVLCGRTVEVPATEYATAVHAGLRAVYAIVH